MKACSANVTKREILACYATLGGNVGIGTTEPNNLLDIVARSESPAVASLNNAWGEAILRLTSPDGTNSTLDMRDADGHGAEIRTNAYDGMDFHMVTPDIYDGGATFAPYTTDNLLLRLGWNNNITFYAQTLDFMGNRLQEVGTPLSSNDAVNKAYVDNGVAMMGDVTGSITDNMLNTENAGIGDRMITGINMAEGTIDDAHVANNLTIEEGTINTTKIGMVTPEAANFTTVGIGTLEPTELLDVRGSVPTPVAIQVKNSMGDATLRGISMEDGIASLELGDNYGYMGSIRNSAARGMEFFMTRPGPIDVPVEGTPVYGLLTLGWDNNVLFNAATIDFGGVRLQNVSDPTASTDVATKAYVDNAVSGGAGTIHGIYSITSTVAQVTITNSNVRPTSTIMVTVQSTLDKLNERLPIISGVSTGSFTVKAVKEWDNGDKLHYIIVN